jgi:hypothetical protein
VDVGCGIGGVHVCGVRNAGDRAAVHVRQPQCLLALPQREAGADVGLSSELIN